MKKKQAWESDDKMRLIDLFHLDSVPAPEEPESPKTFGEALLFSFSVLCHGDKAVEAKMTECLADTKAYCEAHEEAYDERDLKYNEEAAPWLQLIAAVDAAIEADYLCELDWKDDAEEFRSALEEIIRNNGIVFSLKNLSFVREKNIPDWVAQFNECAGQSGITVYGIDIDSDSYVLGAAHLADYAQAAETAGEVGIRITSRPS